MFEQNIIEHFPTVSMPPEPNLLSNSAETEMKILCKGFLDYKDGVVIFEKCCQHDTVDRIEKRNLNYEDEPEQHNQNKRKRSENSPTATDLPPKNENEKKHKTDVKCKINKWLDDAHIVSVKENCIRLLMTTLKNNDQSINNHFEIHDSRTQCEYIINWIFHVLKQKVRQLKKEFASLKKIIAPMLQKVDKVPMDDIKTFVYALCGYSRHCSSTELYFNLYNPLIIIKNCNLDIKNTFKDFVKRKNTPRVHFKYSWNDFWKIRFKNSQTKNILPYAIVINEQGQAMNVFCHIDNVKSKNGTFWDCNNLLCASKCDSFIVNALFTTLKNLCHIDISRLSEYIRTIFSCSNKTVHVNDEKLGHPEICYSNPISCSAHIVSWKILSTHFPSLRTLLNKIYSLKSLCELIASIESALFEGNYVFLQKIVSNAEKVTMEYPRFQDNHLQEKQIYDKYQYAFAVFNQISTDLPTYTCYSCERLLSRSSLRAIDNHIKKLEESPVWLQIGNAAGQSKVNQEIFCCNTCFTSINQKKNSIIEHHQ